MAQKRRIKPVSLVIAILVLAAIVYLLVPRPPIVDVATVTRGDLRAELSTTGVVESDMADVAPRIVSRVAQLLVQEGQVVQQGQLLATLDKSDLAAQVDEARATVSAAGDDLARAEEAVRIQSEQSTASTSRARAALRASEAQLADLERGARSQEIEQARSTLSQAHAEAGRAKSDLARAETLHERGAIPAQQLDAARTAAEVAEGRVRVAEEQFDLLKQGPRPDQVRAAQAQVSASRAALAEAEASANVVRIRRREAAIARAQVERALATQRAAEAQLAYAVIRSPFTGVVARKHLEVGEVAGPQSPIYTIAGLKDIWITAEVDAEDVAAVAVMQTVTITTDAFPGKEAAGIVVRISPIAEPKAVGRVRAKIVRAKIEVESSEFQLKPGMEVNVNGSVLSGRDLVLVPNDALIQVGERYQVFVLRGRRVQPRFVTPGLSNYDLTAIPRGVREGETVITSRLEQLKRGQLVRVRRQPGVRN